MGSEYIRQELLEIQIEMSLVSLFLDSSIPLSSSA